MARCLYAVGFIGVIGLGLASRHYPGMFPAVLGKYPGDALWALMVFCAWGFLKPEWSVGRLGLYALATSYLDECSQIYQAPWINAIRSTTAGHLVLGSEFSWWDMLSYTVGILLVIVGQQCLRVLWKPSAGKP